MSKTPKTYHLGLSIYQVGRGKHRWAISDDLQQRASGYETTHKMAKDIAFERLRKILKAMRRVSCQA